MELDLATGSRSFLPPMLNLHTADGRTWGACGELLSAGDVEGMARQIRTVIEDTDRYRTYCANARGRVEDFFQLHEVMSSYNQIYRMLGNMNTERNFEYWGEETLPLKTSS